MTGAVDAGKTDRIGNMPPCSSGGRRTKGEAVELRVLRYFLAVAGEQNISRAAEFLHVTQPTLSHHMKILCDAEIVVGRKEGKWTHYSISEKGAEQAKECLRQLTTLDVESENKSCCEK